MKIKSFVALVDDRKEFDQIIEHFKLAYIYLTYQEVKPVDGKYKAYFYQKDEPKTAERI